MICIALRQRLSLVFGSRPSCRRCQGYFPATQRSIFVSSLSLCVVAPVKDGLRAEGAVLLVCKGTKKNLDAYFFCRHFVFLWFFAFGVKCLSACSLLYNILNSSMLILNMKVLRSAGINGLCLFRVQRSVAFWDSVSAVGRGGVLCFGSDFTLPFEFQFKEEGGGVG